MKKVLFLVHRIPYPPNKGDKIRSFNELKHLSRHYSVDLLTFADQPADEQYAADLAPYCHQVKVYPVTTGRAKIRGVVALAGGNALSSRYFYLNTAQQTFNQWVAEQDYAAICCFSSSMAEYIFRSELLAKPPEQRPRLVMDFCDVDSDKWRQYAEDATFPMNILYRREYKALKAYECRIQQTFDATVLVSAGEADLFRSQCADCRALRVISNGVDHEYFSPRHQNAAADQTPAPPALVFTGAMDYPVNIKGVLWFVNQVWPLLRRRYPNLAFYIVGSNPSTEINALAAQDGITVTGFVDDIRDYYGLADVCIAPLHQGRGVQNKVLEAMAMGNAVVTTSRANAGVRGQDRTHLLVANSADDFAAAVAQLLNSPAQAAAMGQAARDYVVQNFDWNTNMTALVDLLNADADTSSGRNEGP